VDGAHVDHRSRPAVPTRLVAESLDDVEGERVDVSLYGAVLLAMRLLLTALDACARRERLYVSGPEEVASERGCAIAAILVVPIGEVRRLVSRR
jgi:hypothetical protein